MSQTFDPDPDKAYAECITCGISLTTEDDGNAHMQETRLGANRSHSIRVTNPNRDTRIRSRVERFIEAATERAMEDMDRLVDSGDVTEDEIKTALWGWPDFRDSREEWAQWAQANEETP